MCMVIGTELRWTGFLEAPLWKTSTRWNCTAKISEAVSCKLKQNNVLILDKSLLHKLLNLKMRMIVSAE